MSQTTLAVEQLDEAHVVGPEGAVGSVGGIEPVGSIEPQFGFAFVPVGSVTSHARPGQNRANLAVEIDRGGEGACNEQV